MRRPNEPQGAPLSHGATSTSLGTFIAVLTIAAIGLSLAILIMLVHAAAVDRTPRRCETPAYVSGAVANMPGRYVGKLIIPHHDRPSHA